MTGLATCKEDMMATQPIPEAASATDATDQAADRPQTASSPQPASNQLISIAGIRTIFGLGRTAAYELTHRPGFPDPVAISTHCYRWWASEVDAFAVTLRRERAQQAAQPSRRPRRPDPTASPRRITGTVRAARASKKEEAS